MTIQSTEPITLFMEQMNESRQNDVVVNTNTYAKTRFIINSVVMVYNRDSEV